MDYFKHFQFIENIKSHEINICKTKMQQQNKDTPSSAGTAQLTCVFQYIILHKKQQLLSDKNINEITIRTPVTDRILLR